MHCPELVVSVRKTTFMCLASRRSLASQFEDSLHQTFTHKDRAGGYLFYQGSNAALLHKSNLRKTTTIFRYVLDFDGHRHAQVCHSV